MTPETVPARKDPPKVDIYSQSRASQLAGHDPNFEYQEFSENPEHPSFIGKKLRDHEYGSPAAGYCMIKGWEVVKRGDVIQGKARADQGAGVDTLIRNGRSILCRLPKDEHAKYALMDNRALDQQAKRLQSMSRSGGQLVGMKETLSMGTMESGAQSADITEMLKE
jgi:hypothetical protein